MTIWREIQKQGKNILHTIGVRNPWQLIVEDTGEQLSFTSLLSLTVDAKASVLSNPVEQGGFAAYNKARSAKTLSVTLGLDGGSMTDKLAGIVDKPLGTRFGNYDHDAMLTKLDELQKTASLLTLITPAVQYPGLTLGNYNYHRKQKDGSGMLVVDLTLVEVRQIPTTVLDGGISSPKNPASAGTVNTGRTQAQPWSGFLA